MGRHGFIAFELEQIRLNNGGVLKPSDVVEAARDEEHPLHNCFEWDDTEAAEKYRLWQARQLIKVVVNLLPQAPNTPHQVYVSLNDDRKDGTGYRSLVEVMQSNELRAKLLDQAAEEFDRWERKYQDLQELAEVFEAMKVVKSKARSKARKATEISAAI